MGSTRQLQTEHRSEDGFYTPITDSEQHRSGDGFNTPIALTDHVADSVHQSLTEHRSGCIQHANHRQNIVVGMGSTPQPGADKTVERDRFIQWLSLAQPSRTDKEQTQVINTRVKVILLSSASNKASKNGYNNPHITLRKRPPKNHEAEWHFFC